MGNTVTIISAFIAVVALFITARTLYFAYKKIKIPETITFIRGNHKITVSGHYNKQDSKKLMQL